MQGSNKEAVGKLKRMWANGKTDGNTGDIASDDSDSESDDDDEYGCANDRSVPILTFLGQSADSDTNIIPVHPPSPKRAMAKRYHERLLLEVAKTEKRLAIAISGQEEAEASVVCQVVSANAV